MRDIKTESAWRAAEAFDIPRVSGCAPYGNGHINRTYLVDAGRERYILQAINTDVFPDVDALMHNISFVCDTLAEKVKSRGGIPGRDCLSVILTKDGLMYYRDLDSIKWRMYPFIEATICRDTPDDLNELYEAARTFGAFTADMLDVDAGKLKEVIPDFHNTKARYDQLLDAIKNAIPDRKKEAEAEIDFAVQRKDHCRILYDYIRTRSIPKRVTHNDTKLNNVLLDAFTGTGRAVIDLDTVMPGTICWDFGDFMRFACNTAREDETDISKVHFSLEAFAACAEGYMYSMAAHMTRIEIRMLAEGVRLMTFECGMRFLADYLRGDKYFRTTREKQNLDRCRVEFQLVREIEEHMTEIKEIIYKLQNKYQSNSENI